jgi:hypothetical protein
MAAPTADFYDLVAESVIVQRNARVVEALDRPVTAMISEGGYTIREQDGVVQLSNKYVKIHLTVQEVDWVTEKPARPDGPTHMDPERKRRMNELTVQATQSDQRVTSAFECAATCTAATCAAATCTTECPAPEGVASELDETPSA